MRKDLLTALGLTEVDPEQVGSFDFARATDEQLGELTLDAGELLFWFLTKLGISSRNVVHLRVGDRDLSQADGVHPTNRWERWVNPENAEGPYDLYSRAKQLVAALTGLNSDVAGRTPGVSIPEDGKIWNGGVPHLAVATARKPDGDPGPVLAEFESDAGTSGVQGNIDKVISALMAYLHAELKALRYKAQHGIA